MNVHPDIQLMLIQQQMQQHQQQAANERAVRALRMQEACPGREPSRLSALFNQIAGQLSALFSARPQTTILPQPRPC